MSFIGLVKRIWIFMIPNLKNILFGIRQNTIRNVHRNDWLTRMARIILRKWNSIWRKKSKMGNTICKNIPNRKSLILLFLRQSGIRSKSLQSSWLESTLCSCFIIGRLNKLKNYMRSLPKYEEPKNSSWEWWPIS